VSAERLIAERRDRWERFAALLESMQKGGPAGLGGEGVREFARLYRETVADLARLRTRGADPDVEAYLERLVAGGHNALYRTGEGVQAGGLLRFLASGFPRLVRRSRASIAAAGSLWILGALLAWAVAMIRPDLARDLCPQVYLDRAEAAVLMKVRGGDAAYLELPSAFLPLFSSQLVANNVQATFVAFAFGITAGIGTAFVLLMNGVLFGAVAAVFLQEGVGEVFGFFVAGHGFVEIPAFLIAGAAGLRLGGALLRPGHRTRRDALVHEAIDAGRLLGGTTVLLVVAAMLETLVSPSDLSGGVKLTAGLVAGALVLTWLLAAGRGEEAEEEPLRLPTLAEGLPGPAPPRR